MHAASNDRDLDLAFTSGALLTVTGSETHILKNVGLPLNHFFLHGISERPH